MSVNYSKQGDLGWEDLKRLFARSNWKYGIYENEKYIEAVFEISNEKGQRFYYQINNGYYRCMVNVIEKFPVKLTSELFILATHFNNLTLLLFPLFYSTNFCYFAIIIYTV